LKEPPKIPPNLPLPAFGRKKKLKGGEGVSPFVIFSLSKTGKRGMKGDLAVF